MEIVEITEEQESILEKNLVWMIIDQQDSLLSNIISKECTIIDKPNLGRFFNLTSWRGEKIVRFFDVNQKKASRERYDYFFYRGFQEIWITYLRKLILNRIYAQIHDFSKMILIKESDTIEVSMGANIQRFSSSILDLILKILPNSKVIVVLDDGELTVSSQVIEFINGQKTTWQGIKQVTYKDKASVIDYHANLWANQKKILLEFLEKIPQRSLLLIHSKNFHNNPKETVLQIFNFLNIDSKLMDFNKNPELNKKINNLSQKITDLDNNDKELIRNIILDVKQKLESSIT